MSTSETFQHVGPRVEYGEVEISYDEAEHFRLTAQKGTKINELEIGESSTRIWTSAYTNGFMSDAAGDYDAYSTAFYAKTLLESDPDYWRSVISFARFNDKHKNTKIYNIYEVEAFGGEVTKATRQVRIIRTLSQLTFDQLGEPTEDVYSRQRKKFETPMTSNDILMVRQRVDRTISRNRATRGR